ncbi:guanylate kinase [Canibacter sp. lx-72]|uniref:guanylate kinase n=1 Tax=Canibacter zhuwentaonis TaxID=2837491 RepID=UPI001BDCF4B4|nr:guanylate kinase [Canibacter zhuwentaonis]MBT1017790.1 guanylate kinase [Canibacter zhuwentaonis]
MNSLPPANVDRRAASQAAIKARRERAVIKEALRTAEIKPQTVVLRSQQRTDICATLRVQEFLRAMYSVGRVRAKKIMTELKISETKKLGGLGRIQRERLMAFLERGYGQQNASVLTVLAGPTAVGKGTVVRHLLQNFTDVVLSVSATTRDPRPGEVHGRDYYFVSEAEFDELIATGEMLEWAVVHGKHRYGTPRKPIADAVAEGKLVLLEIDLQGAREVKKSEPGVKTVFLLPPSWEELERRLLERGTENPEEQKRRLETAKTELAAAGEFDEQIVNDEVARAAIALYEIMHG